MISLLAQAQPDGGMTRTQQLLADDPLWLIILKVVALFAVGVVLTLFMINWERKVVGRMQQRPGPNRVGPGGWLQSLATAFATAAFFYFALEKFFQIGLLKGPIEPLIGL